MAEFHEHAEAGVQAISEQRYGDAIEAFTAALEMDASRPDMNNALGMAYLHRGEVGSGLPFLEKAVALAEPYDHPDHQALKRHFHMGLASAYQLADRIGDAHRILRGVINRWPDDAEAYLNLAALLLNSCMLDEGLEIYKSMLARDGLLDEEATKAAEAVSGSIAAFLDVDNADPGVFIEAHRDSYVEYFDQVVKEQEEAGWMVEAARMSKPSGPGADPLPFLAEGARPYALTRADLVNPETGEVAQVYSDTEPMMVAVEGLEPLAQAPIMLPWDDWAFDVYVCTQCPWHWLQITVQFARGGDPEKVISYVDDLIGDWYLHGYNGDFGEKDSGRFHYITDPEVVGERTVSYVVDCGRARYDAISSLLGRLTVLHESHPIRRVLFGAGHAPD